MFVLQALCHTLGLFHLNRFGCGIQRIVGFATFRRAAHVSSRMRQRDSRFRQANKFHCFLRRNCKWQRFRIGKPNIFARKNHDAPCDETEVFAGMKHFASEYIAPFSSEARMLLINALIVS